MERTKVSFELTTDEAVDYAYVILPSDQQAPASAEALFAGPTNGIFKKWVSWGPLRADIWPVRQPPTIQPERVRIFLNVPASVRLRLVEKQL